MAAGGWSYYYHVEYPHDGSAASEQATMAALQATMESMTGWSRHTDQATYGSRALWWSIEHTTGARVVFVYVGDSGSASVFIAGANDVYGTSRTEFAYEDTLWMCYVPSSCTASFDTNPTVPSFLPETSPRFYPMTRYVEHAMSSAGCRHHMHILTRGDGIIILREMDAHIVSDIDTLLFGGECLNPLRHVAHPTEPDTGVNAKQAFMMFETVTYSATKHCQFYSADGTLRNDGQFFFRSEPIKQDVCDDPPWVWMSPSIYVSESDLDIYGIVTGNGIKGIIDAEWLRLLAGPFGPVNPKQQLNGGDFVYTAGGIAVGYDASNGAMQ